MKNYLLLLVNPLGILFSLPEWFNAQDHQAVRFCFVGDLMQHGSQIRAALQDDGTYLNMTAVFYM